MLCLAFGECRKQERALPAEMNTCMPKCSGTTTGTKSKKICTHMNEIVWWLKVHLFTVKNIVNKRLFVKIGEAEQKLEDLNKKKAEKEAAVQG